VSFRASGARHLVAWILVLSPNAPLAIESPSLRRGDVLMIQDVDKKSNYLQSKKFIGRGSTDKTMRSNAHTRGTRGMGISVWPMQNDEHVRQVAGQKALSFG
jgi:hypothetical protein